MTIERTGKEIVFKLPANTDIDRLQEFVDLLTFFEISGKSKVTQKQLDELVSETKKGRWKKTRDRLGI